MSEYTAFAARNQHLIKVAPSRLERHTDAFYLADSVSGTSLARYMNGEIAHVHGQGDFSGHATLAPADCTFPLNILNFMRPTRTYSKQVKKYSNQTGANAIRFQEPMRFGI